MTFNIRSSVTDKHNTDASESESRHNLKCHF